MKIRNQLDPVEREYSNPGKAVIDDLALDPDDPTRLVTVGKRNLYEDIQAARVGTEIMPAVQMAMTGQQVRFAPNGAFYGDITPFIDGTASQAADILATARDVVNQQPKEEVKPNADET